MSTSKKNQKSSSDQKSFFTPTLKTAIAPDDHAIGGKDARIVLLEYGDFECPHCGRAYPIVKNILKKMGDDMLFVYRHFPLSNIHPHAEHAAEASEIAGAEGKFWEMHDMIFENQDHLDDASLAEYAVKIGIDPDAFAEELEASTYKPRVMRDFLSGVYSGVHGTPTFFINGQRYDGYYGLDQLLEALHDTRNRKTPPVL